MDEEFSQRFMRTIEGFVAVHRCNSCQQLGSLVAFFNVFDCNCSVIQKQTFACSSYCVSVCYACSERCCIIISVCLSVHHILILHFNDYIDGRGITVIFFSPTAVTKFRGNPLSGGFKYMGVEKFSTRIIICFGNVQDMPMVTKHIRSFHSIHDVVDRGVLQAMWEELVGKVGHRDQLIIW